MTGRMKIVFTKQAAGHTDSDCTVCKHDSICYRSRAMSDMRLPMPFSIYFDCEHFVADEDLT